MSIKNEKTASDYADIFFNSISTIVEKVVRDAGYNKTIQATIISCQDQSIGKYKVQYQDGYWYAYSSNIDTSYSQGTFVYIMIPNGDMSKDKVILGAVDKLGLDYVTIQQESDNYTFSGYNLFNSNTNFNLWSKYPEELILYDYENNIHNITIDEENLYEFISNSSHVLLSTNVQTNLPLLQQFRGNYGITVEMLFKSNQNENLNILRQYTLDTNIMSGDPYNFKFPVEQKAIFSVDGENFIRINKVYLFVKDFPITEVVKNDQDIFFTNLIFMLANEIPEENKTGLSLNLIAPQGYVFGTQALETDTRTIEAQVKINNKKIRDESALKFYWFVENTKAITSSQYFNKYGGQGWQCLNDKNILSNEANEDIIEYVPATKNFTITANQIGIRSTKYKCTVVYQNMVFSKEFTIIKYNVNYMLEIKSNEGIKFSHDTGTPILECVIQDNNGNILNTNPENFDFVWSKTDSTGVFTSLAESALSNQLQSAIVNYKNFKLLLDKGTITEEDWYDQNNKITNLQHLYDLLAIVKSLSAEGAIENIYQNFIFYLKIAKIINYNIFKCSVFQKTGSQSLIGTAEIILTNDLKAKKDYYLTLNNANQIFKYDENGLSPEGQDYFSIAALDYTITNRSGEALTSEELRNVETEWTIPLKNTLIDIPSSYTGGTLNADESYITYYNLNTFAFNIIKHFDYSKTENNISLKVKYKGEELIAQTNFIFFKEGDAGTSGSQYQVTIVPNAQDLSFFNRYPTIYYYYNTNNNTINSNFCSNWTPKNVNKCDFLAQLWHNGELIFSNTTADHVNSEEGIPVTLTWSILQNRYHTNVTDISLFNINESTGEITLNTTAINSNINEIQYAANIIKVTILYNGLQYYATLPLISVKQLTTSASQDTYNADLYSTLSYHVELKKNTGFRYVTYKNDGTKPSYDKHAPFEILLTKRVDNTYINGLSSIQNNTAQWKITNQYKVIESVNPTLIKNKSIYTYNSSNAKWVVSSQSLQDTKEVHLIVDNIAQQLKINTIKIKPSDIYNGYLVNNALTYSFTTTDNKTLEIYIPIHLMLNRFFNSALNSWDGNSIDLGNDSGTILTPQIGAGVKENDNTFTGIVMGKIKNNNSYLSNDEIGLMGYHEGVRTIWLDANTGKTELGSVGKGQIIFNPSSDSAIIQSGSYTKKTANSTGEGMQIDLSEPSIDFGTGNFSVDKNGYLVSKGGGSIAGWDINDNEIISNNDNTGMHSITSGEDSSAIAFWTGGRRTSTPSFYVRHDGYLSASTGVIGSGTNKIKIGAGCIYSHSKETKTTNTNGFFIGQDGIALGTTATYNIGSTSVTASKFQVNQDGTLFANSAYLTGRINATSGTIGSGDSKINIGAGCIYSSNKNAMIANSTGFFIGNGIALGTTATYNTGSTSVTASKFQVNVDGTLFANSAYLTGRINANYLTANTSGSIGGWNISSSSIYKGNSNSYNTNGIMYFGNNGLSISTAFAVSSAGVVSATGANISGVLIAGAGSTISNIHVSDTGIYSNNYSTVDSYHTDNRTGFFFGNDGQISLRTTSGSILRYENDSFGIFGHTGSGTSEREVSIWNNPDYAGSTGDHGVKISTYSNLMSLTERYFCVGNRSHSSQSSLYAELRPYDGAGLSVYHYIFHGNMYVSGMSHVAGDFTVDGVKSRIVDTEDYGNRLLYCYETPTPMFGDIGDGVIGDDGLCYIQIDPTFSETASTDIEYQVFLQKYGAGDVFVKERHGTYFIVQGTPNLAFGWELKAKQRDYEMLRLNKKTESADIKTIDYGELAYQHIDEITQERISETI